MRRVVSFFMVAVLPLILILPVGAQKQARIESGKTAALSSTTEFASAEAVSAGSGVFIKWQMKTESGNLGFDIYRTGGGAKQRINPFPVGGGFLKDNENTVFGESYTFFDPQGSLENKYLIETLPVSGQKIVSNLIYVNYAADLERVAGKTSAQLIADSKNKNYRIEKNEVIFPKQLPSDAALNALPPNLEAQRFIAAQPGVKIGVKKEGIYRVSRTELENAGFDVNAPSANWQLYMNGNQQAMTVGGNADFIEFYGRGIDTLESETQIYYLINGAQPGKRIQTSTRRRIGGNVVSESFEQSFYKADRVLYVSSIRNGDANNFFSGNIVNTNGSTIAFNLDGIDRNFEEAVLTVGVQGITATPHNVNVTLNGVLVDSLSGNGFELMTKTIQIPTSLLNEGANSIMFKVPSATNDVSLVESFRISYARHYLARENALSFYAKHFKKSEIRGFTGRNIRVYDTTYPDAPTILTNLQPTENNQTFGVIIPSNRSRKMFAAAESAILPAASIEENTPSALSTANHQGKLIIISHKNWMDKAQDWANYRSSDGFSVEIVRIDDIFDEFNYGITSANSIRSFLQFARENWQIPPEYVLILGDASWDPRGYTTNPFTNFVPTKMFDTAYEETGSDEALADFDEDGLSEIAIGRIPAKTGADISLMLEKAMIFEQTSGQGFTRGALFASDLPIGYDFAGMNQRLANELPAGTAAIMINRGDANARANLLAELNVGRYLVNYSGHGSPSLWAAASFYSSSDTPLLANGANYSIFTMLTCLNGYFMAANNDSLAELVLKAPDGGGAAVWASTGKTTPDVQEVLAKRFYQKISLGEIQRMGDLIKDAKQNVTGGRDVRLSWTLLGDPTLKVN